MRHRLKLTIILFFITLGCSGVWAGEMTEMWEAMYGNAQSYQEKLRVMTRIITMEDQEFAPFLVRVAEELLIRSEDPMDTNERTAHYDLQRIVCREIGDLNALEGMDVLYNTLVDTDDAFLQGDIIVSLGKIKAVEYAPVVAKMLEDINNQALVYDFQTETETVAAACIRSLAYMREEIGFEPVFFVVANNNFTRPTVDVARQLVGHIVEDPSSALVDIVDTNDVFTVKLLALQYGSRFEMPDEGRIALAAIGIAEGVRFTSNDPSTQGILRQIRVISATMLANLTYDDTEILDNLIVMFRESTEINERLASIVAIGSGPAELAAQTLSDHLTELNGNPGYRGQDAMRDAIATIEQLDRLDGGAAALSAVEFSNWSSRVERAARNALSN